ncbi:proline/glycine betaine ABC superfamily ATP binding cassette transporter, ABC protein [Neisseria shayeganii 871]|uniref:Proline/glycine betaine ABC superfamily ATP binding cassette transporter, ABC protein n=2 Tax=Neisseria shayeganii TaxID=607712 RepID=G4CI31_9NEIS|nr:proline/glycine betaine ABC superfamily ATP binding cassette transporter, ABC protein [Neisseria shayeganii 871]
MIKKDWENKMGATGDSVMIEFRNVSKHYGGQAAVADLNLSVYEGEFFVLVGGSGSGKSTTLRMINALTEPTEGNVYFRGQRIKDYPIRPLRHRIGYVLQQIALFPTMTVAQNIGLMPDILGWSKAARQARMAELLELAGLPAAYAARYPHELSGGEQQRIGILRALAAKPDILLMDEPFSALDPLSRRALQDAIADIHRRLGTTIVFVTHDMQEALRLGCRIGVMEAGRLLQADTPAAVQHHPATPYVASLFRHTQTSVENVLADIAKLSADEQRQLLARWPAAQAY